MPNTHTVSLDCDLCDHTHDSLDSVNVVLPFAESDVASLYCDDQTACHARYLAHDRIVSDEHSYAVVW